MDDLIGGVGVVTMPPTGGAREASERDAIIAA
jgi:hypothetical protein